MLCRQQLMATELALLPSGTRSIGVIATYEAGWSGFWLARWLVVQGVEVHVVQP